MIAPRIRQEITPPEPWPPAAAQIARELLTPEPADAHPFADAEIISIYTRAQAIEDGVLVDVTETAREAGITVPVALTRTVYDTYVKLPPRVRLQDERGRLWDVIWMLSMAMRGLKARGDDRDRFIYIVLVRNDNAYSRPPKRVRLKSIIGPGDEGEPVITVMLPEED